MNKLLIITGISGSGKTTLQKALVKKGWNVPLNFSTRKPRNENELDEYIFLTRDQFFIKMKNGDFLETTNYNSYWYGISSILPEGNICLVLDPVGREQVLEKINRGFNIPSIFKKGSKTYRDHAPIPKYNTKTIFLQISKPLQLKRLKERGDKEDEIKNRIKNDIWITPNVNSIICSGSEKIEDLILKIENDF